MLDYINFWDNRHNSLDELRSGGDKGISKEDNYEFYIHRLSTILTILNKYFLYQKPLNILDAGCGKGFITRLLKKCGHNVNGIDSSENAIHYARTHDSDTYTVSEISTYKPEKYYDVIICIDVLFHVLDQDDWQEIINKLCNSTNQFSIIIVTDRAPTEEITLSNYIVYRSITTYVNEFNKYGYRLSETIPYDYGANPINFLIFKNIITEKIYESY